MTEMQEEVKRNLEKVLAGRPHIFRVDKFRQQLDGNSAGVLSNMDIKGTGPKNPFSIGRKTAYLTSDYIDWVVGRISSAVK